MFLLFQNLKLRPSHERSIAAVGRFWQYLRMILTRAWARSNKRSIATGEGIVANWYMIANPYANRHTGFLSFPASPGWFSRTDLQCCLVPGLQ
jgi:hypothetical protein